MENLVPVIELTVGIYFRMSTLLLIFLYREKSKSLGINKFIYVNFHFHHEKGNLRPVEMEPKGGDVDKARPLRVRRPQ